MPFIRELSFFSLKFYREKMGKRKRIIISSESERSLESFSNTREKKRKFKRINRNLKTKKKHHDSSVAVATPVAAVAAAATAIATGLLTPHRFLRLHIRRKMFAEVARHRDHLHP